MTSTNHRIEALRTLKIAAESVRALSTLAVQRPIHNLMAARLITVREMLDLQAEWNGVSDHLDAFINTLEGIYMTAIDDAHDEKISRDMDPEPHGSRDTFVPHPDGPAPEHFNPLQD